jgi:predicted esterase
MLAFAMALAQAASPAPETLRVRPGEIASGIRCGEAPRFSYELYVPTAFDPRREWPILYVFDPRGRGRVAAELFRAGAEARGFLVASSNDTESDNPDAPNAEVVRALWNDTHGRLPIDGRRRYAAGFSGGARLACNLGLALKGDLAGVIAVGGGFPPSHPPVRDLPFAWFGSVGSADFNYYEMRELDATLEKFGARHRLEVFEGDHAWTPEAVAAQGIEWLDLMAMGKGTLAKDAALVEAVWSRERERARRLEQAGRGAEALDVLASLRRDLGPLRDTGEAAAEIARLGKPAADERERRAKLDRRDAGLNARADRVIESVRSGEELPPVGRVVAELGIPRLLEEARRGGYEADSARRRIAHIAVQTSFYVPRELLARGEWRRALVLLQVATAAQPESPVPQWRLACAQARAGARKDALRSLDKAVDLGLRLPRARVRDEPELESLRGEAEFTRILERLKEEPAAP